MTKENTVLSPREQKKALQTLIESPGWNMVMEVLQAQADEMQQKILFAPVQSEGDVYALERVKGSLEGRLAVGALVATMLENANHDIAVEEKMNVEA